ncbi:hypothetical protein TrVGV298_002119 [Trichoderma virens]|nr:hypothetical protein TrVGV298_002119 [Trichoderma virens]
MNSVNVLKSFKTFERRLPVTGASIQKTTNRRQYVPSRAQWSQEAGRNSHHGLGTAPFLSLDGVRGLGSVFSYATNRWTLWCITMAAFLNRTHIFAATQRRLRLRWQTLFGSFEDLYHGCGLYSALSASANSLRLFPALFKANAQRNPTPDHFWSPTPAASAKPWSFMISAIFSAGKSSGSCSMTARSERSEMLKVLTPGVSLKPPSAAEVQAPHVMPSIATAVKVLIPLDIRKLRNKRAEEVRGEHLSVKPGILDGLSDLLGADHLGIMHDNGSLYDETDGDGVDALDAAFNG